MGKKKQLKKLAEANIQMLKSGKIKVKKGQKINLKSFVNSSIEDSIVSRLDGIISKEDVVLDTADYRVDVTTNLTSDIKTAELAARVQASDVIPNTIVIPVNKKDALDSFDFLDDSSLGIILRTSTLASIYTGIKDKWTELNKDDSSCFTNVMYVPNVMVFLDCNSGKIKKQPFYINVMIVAVPSPKQMVENGLEKVSDEDATARLIADVVESGIKCGAKNMIIDPFAHKLLIKDPYQTSVLWNQIATGQRFIEQFRSVIFSIDDDNLYIIFNGQRTKTKN